MHLKKVVIKKGYCAEIIDDNNGIGAEPSQAWGLPSDDGKPHAAVDVQFEARVVQVVRNSGRDVRFDRGVARFF